MVSPCWEHPKNILCTTLYRGLCLPGSPTCHGLCSQISQIPLWCKLPEPPSEPLVTCATDSSSLEIIRRQSSSPVFGGCLTEGHVWVTGTNNRQRGAAERASVVEPMGEDHSYLGLAFFSPANHLLSRSDLVLVIQHRTL